MAYNDDRDDWMDEGLQELIDMYERMVAENSHQYFDHSNLEHILEYYLECFDFDKAVQLIALALDLFPQSAYFKLKNIEISYEQGSLVFSQALLQIDQLIEEIPYDTELYFVKLEFLLNESHSQMAIDTTDIALQYADEEERLELYLLRAEAYQQMEEYRRAYASLEDALRIEPNYNDALEQYEFMLEETDWNDEGNIDFLTEYLIQNDKNARAWLILGNIYKAQQNYPAALHAFYQAADLTENWAMPCACIGDTYFDQQDYEKALYWYLQVMYNQGPDAEILHIIGVCHFNLNHFIKAQYYFKRATQQDANHAEAWFRLGVAEFELKQNEKALAAFKRTLQLNDNNREVIFALAMLNNLMERPAEAIKYCLQYLQQDPQNKKIWLLLSGIYFEEAYYEEAVTVILRALEFFGDDAEINYMGFCYLHYQGLNAQAQALLEKALQIDPSQYEMIYKILPNLHFHSEIQKLINTYL